MPNNLLLKLALAGECGITEAGLIISFRKCVIRPQTSFLASEQGIKTRKITIQERDSSPIDHINT